MQLTLERLLFRAWRGPALASAALIGAVGALSFVASRLLVAPVAVEARSLVRVLILATPAIASLSLPLAVALSLVGLARRWEADGEWVSLRAAGAGLRAFLRPVLLLALGTGASCYALAHHIEPAARAGVAGELAGGLSLKPGRLARFGPLALAAEEVEGEALRGVFFALDGEGGPRVGGAAEGELDGAGLTLRDGTLHSPGPPTVRVSFERLQVPLPRAERRWELVERSDRAIANLVARMEAQGHPAHYERAALQKRSAWPVAAALLVLAALPLGLRGVTPPALAVVGFWTVARLCDHAAPTLGGWLSAWIPTFLLGICAVASWWTGVRR